MTPTSSGPERKRSWRSLATLFELFAVPITSGRMNVVWRLLGFVFVLLWLQHMDDDAVFEFADKSAAALDALGLLGLLLLAAGPSLVVLLGGAVVGMWFLTAVLRRASSS